MMEDKIRGTNDWPQVLTRGLVPRHVINQARRHVSRARVLVGSPAKATESCHRSAAWFVYERLQSDDQGIYE